MANWSVLKTAVANIINTNGSQAITGQLLQNVLNNIITNVGENSTFAGTATVDTNPGAPDGPVFYLAATAGIYPNFNSLEVLDGEAIIFEWDNGTWSKKTTGFATQEKLTSLQEEVRMLEGESKTKEYVATPISIQDGFINLQQGNVYEDTTLGFKVNTYPITQGQTLVLDFYGASVNVREYQILDKDYAIIYNGGQGSGGKKTITIDEIPNNASYLQVCYSTECILYVTPVLKKIINSMKCVTKAIPTDIVNGFININYDNVYEDTTLGFKVNTYNVSEGDYFYAIFKSANESTRQYVVKNKEGETIERGALGDNSITTLSIVAPKDSYILQLCYNKSYEVDVTMTPKIMIDVIDRLFGIADLKNIINPIEIAEEKIGFINTDTGDIVELGSSYEHQYTVRGYYVTPGEIYYLNFLSNNQSTRQYIIRDKDGNTLSLGDIGNNSKIEAIVKAPDEAYIIYISTSQERSFIVGLNEYIFGSNESQASIFLPKKIYAIVGDTLQVFFDSIIESTSEVWVSVEGAKGKVYNRYYEFTPTISDVGEHLATFIIRNNDGKTIAKKTCSIVVKDVPIIDYDINVLKVGDSTTETGVVPNELSRRLKGTNGYVDNPESYNLNRISLKGRCHSNAFGVPNPAGDEVGWEATGGWSWQTYSTYNTSHIIRLDVTNAMNVNVGDSYSTNTGGVLIVSEKNVNESTGVGIIRGYWAYGKSANKPSAPGTLTLYEGNGQNSIDYNSSYVELFSPFVKSDGTISFMDYVNTYLDGRLDVIIFTLGINGSGVVNERLLNDYSSTINTAKKVIDALHLEYPKCKVIIDGLNLPCQNMGGTTKGIGINGTNKNIHRLNEYYEKFANSDDYRSFVTYNDICSQVDSINGYPQTDKAMNTRTNKTEMVGTNMWHPNNEGYYQIADAELRTLLHVISQ